MEALVLAGGRICDPANGIDAVGDICIQGGKIVSAPAPETTSTTTHDMSGRVVTPAGIDMHSHMTGAEVRHVSLPSARANPWRGRSGFPSGVGGIFPSCGPLAAMYIGMGYLTAFDAAIIPSRALAAHQSLSSLPVLDKGIYSLVGNHSFALDLIARGEQERLNAFIAWVAEKTKCFAMKVVNPGGVDSFVNGGEGLLDLDERSAGCGLTPRQIITALAAANDANQMPHAIHLHANRLGLPGNSRTTVETMRCFTGRGHLTHVQFHAYRGDPNTPDSIASGAEEVAECINANPLITADIGQVMFGEGVVTTGDLPAGEFLRRVLKSERFVVSYGCDGGCSVMPVKYKEKSFVHGLQWAVGLELFLRVKNPWQIAMSTDHPNGGSFLSYPKIIAYLMCRDRRNELLNRLPPKVRERSRLGDLDRQYTLSEIITITRAAPARMLGLSSKGHLGPGADADICVYTPNDDPEAMFSVPHRVYKGGKIVLEETDLRQATSAPILAVQRPYEMQALGDELRGWIEQHICVQYSNFGVDGSLPEDVFKMF